MKNSLRLCFASCVTAVIASLANVGNPGDAAAQGAPSARALGSRASVEAYWTPERLRAAVPLDIPAARAGKASEPAPTFRGPAQTHRGSGPTIDVGTDLHRQLYVPEADGPAGREAARNFGTAGFYFTTGRVFPAAAVRAYPNRAAGKLFFSDPVHGGNFVCSASAIALRLVVTAGHCVAHGSPDAGTRHFYSNMLFVPAFSNGAAPFGRWSWRTAWTTNNWFLSGAVPNQQDVAVIEVFDIVRQGQLQKLGNVTGWLGWWTQWGRQYPNHVTQLGYPCNLDSCNLMQINNAQGVRVVNGNVEIGSAMQGGSSGGPWVQDHGVFPAGGPAFTAGNWVLGTTSYQYLGSPSPMILGASIFQNAGFPGHGFGDLWNAGCANQAGNC